MKNGIIQANHGKMAPLKRLGIGDRVIYYSPKTQLQDGEPFKAFTAIAETKDDNIYQETISEDFKPFRRKARYDDCTEY
jgi:hypothetical protein